MSRDDAETSSDRQHRGIGGEMTVDEQRAPVEKASRSVETEILLSVVVPVYNQAESIAENVRVIRDSVATGLGGATEVIVVSDGSIDDTEEQALAATDERTRVLHYDRNMGKGYAVKIGALEARGRWIAYVDADLDLDPALLPAYVARAEEAELDFAIGSKRHPDAQVNYPQSRRAASWLFQQAVRLLFRLDVRDTQVGIKVFRREVAEQVLPLLLVKRFAFDIELLAVSRALGFVRIEEQPIRLDYRFTGSGVRSLAVMWALVDTLAVFYRLRVLRTYQRKSALVGRFGWTRPRGYEPVVSVRLTPPDAVNGLHYPTVESLDVEGVGEPTPYELARQATGEAVAVFRPGVAPTANWLAATVPFLARPEIGAVVTPSVAPSRGNVRERAAAAVRESRIGGGSQYFRFMPGNLRVVRDFPADALVARREVLLELEPGTPLERVVSELTARGRDVLYTPESVVASAAPPLIGPHLRAVAAYGGSTAFALRRRRFAAARPGTVLLGLGLPWLLVGWLPGLVLPDALRVWVASVALYVLMLVGAAIVASLKFRSLSVGLVTAPALVATHVAYLVGLIRGH
jgi:glycosyltransferase involved in cell wall biosynthesis